MTVNYKYFAMRNEGSQAIADMATKVGLGDYQARRVWRTYITVLEQLINAAFEEQKESIRCNIHEWGCMESRKLQMLGRQKALILDAFSSIKGLKIGVSRIFDREGKHQLRIGNRPGYSGVEAQIAKLPKGTPLAVIEDDMFSGGTMRELLGRLKSAGVVISEVIVGYQVGMAQELDGVPVRAVYRHPPEQVPNLCDPRDFLMGSRDGGLVVENAGKLYRVPYITPLIDGQARTGISSTGFWKKVIDLNSATYTEMSRLAYRPLLVRDLGVHFAKYVTQVLHIGADTPVVDLCSKIRSM